MFHPITTVRAGSSGAVPGRRTARYAAVALAAATLTAAAPAVAAGPPAAAGPSAVAVAAAPERPGARDRAERAVVAGIERRAHPLRTAAPGGPRGDLAALPRMVGGVNIVGVGEATHGSKELFQLKHRLFQHLVERSGFRTFSLEVHWSAGARLDAYVRTGEGDLRQIMRDEFQFSFEDWRNEEFLALFTWMRAYNRTAAPDRQVRVMGNDIGDVGREQYARVFAWAAEHRPALLPELRQRYAALLALPHSMGERIQALAGKPLAERRAVDADARAALRLLEQAGAVDPWVLQEARVVQQVTKLYAYDQNDPVEQAEYNRHRDRAMAENTVWWQRQTGDRMLVSAHNAHLGYESPSPTTHPKVQGAFLRELVGREYLAVGTTIHRGEYRAMDGRTGQYGVFSTGRAAPGSNEHTLDQVRHRDYYVDLREAGRDPAVGGWLSGSRPTFVVPGSYPNEPLPVSLGRTFDVLVHLHRVRASVPVE
ncbi:erythromycin esterase family protein [Streptomyces sp. NPDC059578]|uniref:erythromycin esterase family protein n=1 Tax=Streptomyces sp. NPDC059578 TaxID=3346874 RepID=UPI00367C3520